MARWEEYNREMAYRFYIADSLHLSVQNKYVSKRLSDIIYEKSDERTGDEIAMEVFERAGLVFGG